MHSPNYRSNYASVPWAEENNSLHPWHLTGMEEIMAKKRTYFRIELKDGWVDLGNVPLSDMQRKGESRLQAAMRFAIEQRKLSFKETGSRYCLLQECEMPTTSGTTGKLVRE